MNEAAARAGARAAGSFAGGGSRESLDARRILQLMLATVWL